MVLPGALLIGGLLAAQFHPPSTKDFVFDCYFSVDLLGIEFCFNFIIALVTASVLIYVLLFLLAFRRPRTVPGKLQSLLEMGLGFVREQIAMPMLGPAADRFLPLLATLFFFILFMNMFEVAPWVNFSASARVAFPASLAIVSWVTYNAVGVAKHGFLGYLRFTCIIPAAPWWIQPLLIPIEFVSNIVIRPITLTIRLAANFVAGHFLLALAFLGTEFFFLNGGFSSVLLVVSVPMSVILVAFEVFVALLQAFIFTVLTASYIGGALAEDH
ncbi:MAG: F0F1 ATP synthase subunit A [Actinomycetota bacterium]|nr:F0F1 ATP synthase subunit A [Actinomycetota bacterium]